MRCRALLILSTVFAIGCATDEPLAAPDTGAGASDTGAPSDTAGATDAGDRDDFGTIVDSGGSDDTGGADASSSDDMTVSGDVQTTNDAGSQTADSGPDLTAAAEMGMPGQPGETCATATDATAGGTFGGDTTGADDDYSSDATADNCPSGSASGGDHVYRLAPSAETTYTTTVTPAGDFDPFLYVKADCAVTSCVDGTVLDGPGRPESLTFTVPAGAEYFLIVDGELFSEGAYSLAVNVQ